MSRDIPASPNFNQQSAIARVILFATFVTVVGLKNILVVLYRRKRIVEMMQ